MVAYARGVGAVCGASKRGRLLAILKGDDDMRATAIALACGVLLAGLGGVAAAKDATAPDRIVQERIDASRAVVSDFATRLKGALVKAMETDGPIGAVEVCQTLAPRIAADASSKTGWRVGRTSLMTRNDANRPDAWEKDVLETFAARKAAGESPEKMESWVVVSDGSKEQFRYMKAIPTAPLCLTCHGTDVAPALRERIDALYPKDRATGYREGDVRGAFTITQPM